MKVAKGHILIYSILLILSICPLVKAQTRDMNVTIDTVTIDYCKGNKNFVLPVRIGNISVSDSIYGLRMVVLWDVSALDINDIVCSQQTICYDAQQDSKRIIKDPKGGRLVIEFGNKSNVLRGNNPLVYLSGKVIANEQVGLPNGWITIFPAIDFESRVKFNQKIGNGYVKFVKDTTPKNIGDVYVKNGNLDTLQETEVSLNIEKLAYKNVKNLSFFLSTDTNKIKIIGWKNGIVYDSVQWKSKKLRIENDTFKLDLEAQNEIDWGGELLKIQIKRNTTKEIFSNLDISGVSINNESCIYKINIKGSEINGKEIKKDSVIGNVENVKQNEIDYCFTNSKLVIKGIDRIKRIELFDNLGRLMIRRENEDYSNVVEVNFGNLVAKGKYHMILIDDKNRKEYKQITIIN